MTEQELARLIATLEHLKHPFDRKQISKLPKTDKRPALDYVNHAHVTNRLNQYAPDWSYTLDEMFTQGGECWVRGTMTIYGSSRVEFGKGKNPLEAMSHFIRRAAMRFGVATDLWAKEDFEESTDPSSSSGSADAGTSHGAALPDVPAQRPAGQGYGEGPTPAGDTSDTGMGDPGEAEGGEATPLAGVAPAPSSASEPHEHVKGKQLASGNWLCSYLLSNGIACGAKFQPRPTVHTRAVEDIELRKDLVS